MKREYHLPRHLIAANPADNKLEENRINQRGRSANKGLEGLAISADGRTLYGIMQHTLLQDSVRAIDGKPTGVNCRLVEVDVKSGAVREFVYQLEQPANGLNEILALGDGQFLVIERDSLVGEAALFKKIMKIDINGATDVQTIDKLPPGSLPDEITPVSKEVFIDFLSPEFALPATQLPEKLEGLTFGQPLSDGRRTLLVSSDNDFEAAWPSFVYVFALSDSADLQTVRVSQSGK